MAIVFWLCCAFVFYTYVGYPIFCWLASVLFPIPFAREDPPASSFTIIIAAHNEGARIESRILEFIEDLKACPTSGELIVVSDGSTDGTAEAARRVQDTSVRVIELTTNVGKAQALNVAVELSRGEVLIFADVRQRWADDALQALLANFMDPSIGGVGGELVLQATAGENEGIDYYWRYEKWIRMSESRIASTVGVSGSIAAVRSRLFRPIPPGTVLDDVYWPMIVVMQGYRVVFDTAALAYDRLPAKAAHEFVRKVRTLAGNFQLVATIPQVLNPFKNPIWWQFLSHKLGRLCVPWAILIELLASAFSSDPILRFAFGAQIFVIVVICATLALRPTFRLPLISAATSFLILNAAAFTAFWVWISGSTALSWRKVDYNDPS